MTTVMYISQDHFDLQCVQDTLTEQGKSCSSIHRSFDEFQLVHMALDHSVIDGPGQTGLDCGFVFLYPVGKALKFWEITLLNVCEASL
jgi:hypothetical protein